MLTDSLHTQNSDSHLPETIHMPAGAHHCYSAWIAPIFGETLYYLLSHSMESLVLASPNTSGATDNGTR